MSATSDIGSFRDCLEGPSAFYNQSDYLETTQRDFSGTTPVPVHYRWSTEKKTEYVSAAALTVLRLALPRLPFKGPASPTLTIKAPLETDWKYKRITLEVDGHKIDAVVMGKASTLSQRRWVLASNVCDESHKNKISSDAFKQFLTAVKGNAIVFNYPGVAATSGPPTRETLIKAYRIMLTFLEDQKQGVGAKEIIDYDDRSWAIVRGEALTKPLLKESIRYAFVKNQLATATPSEVERMARLTGWNLDIVTESKQLQAPEIIIQAAHVKNVEEIKESSQIADTPRISAKRSLAKALLDDPQCPKHNKVFIGVAENVDQGVFSTFLAQKIEELLLKR